MLSAVFLAMAAVRTVRDGAAARIQARTWLLIGVIFAAVSAWLFLHY